MHRPVQLREDVIDHLVHGAPWRQIAACPRAPRLESEHRPVASEYRQDVAPDPGPLTQPRDQKKRLG